MIGRGTAARVIGTAVVVDSKRSSEDTPIAQWASVSKYDTGVNEGASVYETSHYYTRFVEDTYGTLDLYVTLSAAATGRERIRWQIDREHATWVDFSETRVNSDGNLEMAIIKGRVQHRIRATIKERTSWFPPQRFVLTLLDADNCQVADGPTKIVLIIYSRKAPPQIEMTDGGTMTGSPPQVDVTFTLKNADGSDFTMADLVGSVVCYYRVYDATDPYKTPVSTKIGASSGGSSAGTDPRRQSVTWTSGSPVSQVITMRSTLAPAGTYTMEALVERPTVKYDSEWINPDTGVKSLATIDIHKDENQWYFSNDYPALRQDNYGLYIKDGWHPGYPTGYGYGGQTLTTTSLPHVEFFEQSAAAPVRDPFTNNPLEWWVNTDQVTAGPSYTRQLFTVQYCGGPWIGHVPPDGTNYVRAAYRIEPFKTADVDHQHEIISVGYRARQVARSSSVQFKMRNVAPAAGYSAFGPQDQPYISWTQDTVGVAGDSITITDYEGTSATFTAGAEYAVGSTADDTAQNIVDAINSSPLKVVALKAGLIVAVKQGEVNGTHPGVPAYNTFGGYTDRLAVTGGDFDLRVTFLTSKRFVSTAIVDASGNDCRPTAVGGTTGEYYYDIETGTEIWFWSMKNMWGRNSGYAGGGLTDTSAPERLTTSVWGDWYGVYRDPMWGLTVWMVNYVADEPAEFDPTATPDINGDVYRYNQGVSEPNVRAFTAWSNASHPPARTEAAAGEHGWLIESSETGYLPDTGDWDQASGKGYDFTDYSKNLMLFSPVWAVAYDGSDDNQSFNDIKNLKLGTLIHSIQMQMFDDQADFYTAATGSWPDFCPVSLYNWWAPRGGCTSTNDSRPSVTLTVT